MSDVYSSFERDHFDKKSNKKRQDFKSNKSNSRGYKVYEPKSSEKQQLKHEQYPSDQKSTSQPYNDHRDYENYDDYNEYDDYDSKNSRYDKNDNYRPKMHNKSGKRATGSGGKYAVWKKEIVKVNKDSILKSHEAAPVNGNIDGLVRENSNLFVKEKQSPVNKDILELSSNDVDNQLHHKSSGESVASASTNATNDDRKSMETLDMAYDNLDVVKCLDHRINALQTKGKSVSDQSSAKKGETDHKENKGSFKNKECKDETHVNEALSDQTELNEDLRAKKIGKTYKEEGEGKNEKGCEETDESEGERYSNIDLAIERKLLNNEVGSNSDVFDEAGNEKKDDMEALEDNDKPTWDETTLNQALQDARKESNHTPSSPQDLTTFLANIRNQDRKMSLFFGDDEDHDDDFNQIFSAKSIGKNFYRPSIDTNMKSETLEELNGSKSATLERDLSAALGCTNKASGCPETPTSGGLSPHINFLQQLLEKQGVTPLSQVAPAPQTNTNVKATNNMSLPIDDSAAPPGFDKPKFVFKYCGHNYEAKIWFYTDTRNLIQGPFSAREMDEWYTNNNIPSNLSISKGMGNNSAFKPLSYYVERAIQKEIQNLSYNNDYLYYPSPVANGSSSPKIEVDPSYQEAQDILTAVNQYSLQAVQEAQETQEKPQGMLISHNIRETFIDEPLIENSAPISANLFIQGRLRQSKRLAVFDTCNNAVGSSEEQTENHSRPNTEVEIKNEAVKNEGEICQNVYTPGQSTPNVPCSSENNICVNIISALNNLSNPVMNVKNDSNTQSPMNSQSVKNDSSLKQPDAPDYRTQPLSAAQIQMLQNFSWQAFADDSKKGVQEPLAKSP